MELFWLDDAQWNAISRHLPLKQTGPKRSNDRVVISGIIHVLRSGCAWRDCPREYGPYMTVFNRFNRWKHRGIWDRIVATLTLDPTLPPLVMEDGSKLDEAIAARTKPASPATSDWRERFHRRVGTMPRMRALAWEEASAELHELSQAFAGKPIDTWIDAVVEWHMDSLFRHSERSRNVGATDSVSADRIIADVTEIRNKFLVALTCLRHYVDDPARNAPATRAVLGTLFDEMSRPAELGSRARAS
jgi:hypothetical protein